MDTEIIKELEDIGLTLNEINSLQDAGNIKISYYFGSSGRPLLYSYDVLNDIRIVRIGDEWDAVGTMMNSSNNREVSPFSLSLNIRDDTLVIGGWNFSARNTRIKIINSAATGELIIRFIDSINHQITPNTFISKNSFIYLKDE